MENYHEIAHGCSNFGNFCHLFRCSQAIDNLGILFANSSGTNQEPFIWVFHIRFLQALQSQRCSWKGRGARPFCCPPLNSGMQKYLPSPRFSLHIAETEARAIPFHALVSLGRKLRDVALASNVVGIAFGLQVQSIKTLRRVKLHWLHRLDIDIFKLLSFYFTTFCSYI